MGATAFEVKPEHRPFDVTPLASRFFAMRDREVVLAGPAGTGKSRICMELIHQSAQKYPGSRWLMVRRTRKSMTESTLVTWETEVVEPGHPCLLGVSGKSRQRSHRTSYPYPQNGSTVVVQGMDEPVMGPAYDGVYFNELLEGEERAWEELGTRLRHGAIPYQRLIGDTNPGPPSSWIKKRAERGALTLLSSTHHDNPRMWDGKTWTPYGVEYLARLGTLTGVRRARLLEGKWVQAEGVVYERWDVGVHLIDRFRVPPDWTRYWVFDFGFNNPFVWLDCAEDGDGRLYVVHEIYRTKRLVEDHCAVISDAVKRYGIPSPAAVICDHDAEGRATVEKYLGLGTVAAHKAVLEGIQAVDARMRVEADGKPRLMVMRDALIEPEDRELAAAGKPTCTAGEVEGYIWQRDGRGIAGARQAEQPVKRDDHGMDCLRYLCAYFDAQGGGEDAGAPVALDGPAYRTRDDVDEEEDY